MNVTVQKLSSGYWHLRGRGPCNWAQPPEWPCDEAVLRGHASSGASDEFIRSCMELRAREIGEEVAGE